MSTPSPAVSRRDFLAATAAVGSAAVLSQISFAEPPQAPAPGLPKPPGSARNKIDTFDYQGVTLHPSFWQRQFQAARDFYFNVPDDDILHGYRGTNSPGQVLGGWCNTNSDTVLGQWMQGMSRIYKATGDTAMRDKAIHLITEWAKATGPENATGVRRHYPFEKIVGGLVDLKFYAGHDAALGLLEKVIGIATDALDRTRTPANPRPWPLHSGTPLEWYTLGENLFRAYDLTRNDKYREFAEVWLYTPYWTKFLDAQPKDVWGVHAYSHVNSFSSCAMAYAVTGDQKYLQVLKNAYDFMQNTQCFATGGYGPVERLMPPNGNLGVSLELRQNSCEVPCCSWAAFKMARYLMTFTGDAKYGDWIERLVYSGIGAALPIKGRGDNFYYADYRVAGGMKNYARSTFTCCSGTYIQAVTEYHNLIYFKDDNTLYVNLYLPSEVTWTRPDGPVKLTQTTNYPHADTITFTLSLQRPTRFALKYRIPAWGSLAGVSVNGAPITDLKSTPGTWSGIEQEWKNGDKVEIRIPLAFRYVPVDKQHPDRVAVVRGPVVYVEDATVHEPVWGLPATDEELNKVLFASGPGQRDAGLPPAPTSQYALRLTGKNLEEQAAANMPGRGGGTPQAGARFMPFYTVQEVNSYRMYFDRKDAPQVLW